MGKQQSNDLVQLFNEVRLVNHQLVRIVESLHEPDRISAGERGVLEMISRRGPLTVPAMAKERGVTRQLVQVLVDELRKKGFVDIRSNPAHKRSGLVAMTASGVRLWKKMSRREAHWLQSVASKLSNIPAAKVALELATLHKDLESL